MLVPKALVVDDDLAIRESIREVLVQEGYSVETAENGEIGLARMRATEKPDVVLLDLMMPVLSGWEVLEEVQMDPSLQTIPIVVVSALATALGPSDKRGGVRACLSKPLDMPMLAETVRSAIENGEVEGEHGLGTAKTKLRVLLVEDSPDDAELIAIELRRAGYDLQLHRVASAAAFEAALADQPWDVVLSDFTLPGFGGKAALEILKRSGLHVPFIIVSGSVGEAVAVEVMKAGAHDFFPKGNLARLGAAIDREVREAALQRARFAEKARAEADREELLGDLHAAVQARDDFLSIASHELRTPLTALQLQVQVLQRMLREEAGPFPHDRVETKVNVIARQVSRMTTLVQNFLDVNCLTSGHMNLTRERMHLQQVARNAVERMDDLVRQSGSEICIVGEEVEGFWDPLRLDTVVSNLITNALKFGEKRPIEVRTERDDEVARLIVTDRGIGISEDAQRRIFQKFERAVPQKHYGGFGLGLWITQQLVVAHGGNIRVVSEKGVGTAFIVVLPRDGGAGTAKDLEVSS